jgi:phosphatidylserine/phosphatidylglycerophosphate/cardiolipin synthase-like enzyme
MLVDDNLFCGSLNVANCYTSVRYGDGSFRDLNIILKKYPQKRVRDFFRDIIKRNAYFYPEKIKPEEVDRVFDEFDAKYVETEEEALPNGWPDPQALLKATTYRKLAKGDAGDITNLATLDEKPVPKSNEICIFQEETPAHKTEVSTAILEMIKRAERNIKIIQPYVTNVDEFEDLLIQASRDRGVEIEIVTARVRDQPVYKKFLNSDLFSRIF